MEPNRKVCKYFVLCLCVLGIQIVNGDLLSAPIQSTLEYNPCDLPVSEFPVYCHCSSDSDPSTEEEVKCNAWGTPDDSKFWKSLTKLKSATFLEFIIGKRQLTVFPPAFVFQDMPKLHFFILRLGNFTDLEPFAFGNSTSLSDIKIDENLIESLQPHSMANLLNVTVINLGSNRLQEINRDVFHNLPKLKKLYLDRNRIQVLHDYTFRELKNLEELDLHSNNLTVLTPEIFTGLNKLWRLDLQQNFIEFLGDNVFKEVPNLKELDLHGNDIRSISPYAFAGLTELNRLILKGNKLVSLEPKTFQDLRKIFMLNLRDNELETLPENLMEPIYSNLKALSMQLSLKGNRFMCDCRIQWMSKLYEETESAYVRDHLQKLECDLFGYLKDNSGQQVQLTQIGDDASSAGTFQVTTPEETTTYKAHETMKIINLPKQKCSKVTMKTQSHTDAESGTRRSGLKEITGRLAVAVPSATSSRKEARDNADTDFRSGCARLVNSNAFGLLIILPYLMRIL